MINLDQVYILVGLMFAAFAILTLRDADHPTRIRSALFWGLLAGSMLFGSYLAVSATACWCVALVALGGLSRLGVGKPRRPRQRNAATALPACGNCAVPPALIVPVVAVGGTLAAKQPDRGAALLSSHPDDPDRPRARLSGRPDRRRGLAASAGDGAAAGGSPPDRFYRLGRHPASDAGRARGDLPRLQRGRGGRGGRDPGRADELPLVAVLAYCLGMALFTIIMGNAFAAFPVMTAAIGLPFVVGQFGGDPAIVCAIGMLAGFCGTLLTPMAANFNVVPANLLELPDRNAAFNGVIRAQAPTALILLGINIALMYFLAFRF